jgi:hypothetical protein
MFSQPGKALLYKLSIVTDCKSYESINTVAALQWKVATMQQETRPYASGFSLNCGDQSNTHCFPEGTGKEPWATKAVP